MELHAHARPQRQRQDCEPRDTHDAASIYSCSSVRICSGTRSRRRACSPVDARTLPLRSIEHGARHAGHLIELADFALHVVQRPGRSPAVCFSQSSAGFESGSTFTPMSVKPMLLVLLVDALEQRHLLPARAAPGGPEVDHHDLALVLGEIDRSCRVFESARSPAPGRPAAPRRARRTRTRGQRETP